MSVSQHFPNNQYMMLQNHAWIKGPLKFQDEPTDSNKYKEFIHIVSDSTLQITFMKLLLVEF
jgi:hypothetical protein